MCKCSRRPTAWIACEPLLKVAGESGEVGKLYRLDRKFGPIRVVAYDERKLRIASEQDIEVR